MTTVFRGLSVRERRVETRRRVRGERRQEERRGVLERRVRAEQISIERRANVQRRVAGRRRGQRRVVPDRRTATDRSF